MKATPRQKALDYLRHHHVMTLATTGPEGLWAAAVFYANEDFTFYFLSAPTSRHSRNLAANRSVALTVQADYKSWPEIKGIQAEGRVKRLTGVAQARAIKLYGQKFPLVANLEKAPEKIVKAMQKIAWYQVTLTRLYFIDNSVGFGHRDDLSEFLGKG